MLDNPIVELSEQDFWLVWDGFAKCRFEKDQPKNPANEAKRRHKKGVLKAIAAGRKDVPPEPRPFVLADLKPYLTVFPPCMALIMAHAALGHHLHHEERLNLCNYMLTTGWDVEAVIDIFRKVPDFDEKITRAQVEFSEARKYKPANCKKMREGAMCPVDCGSRNPANQ